jgi:hypothetical protein
MKKAFIGSLIGIAIVMALDSFARVIISIYQGEDIMMFSYSQYPGMIWPVILTIISGFTAFFGGMFSLTYGRSKRMVNLSGFLVLLILLRYGQVYMLTGIESLFYPIAALVLSLIGLMLAWQLTGKTAKQSSVSQESDHKRDYHQPEDEWDH